MKIFEKDIEIVKVMSGNAGDIYSIQFIGDSQNELEKFLNEFGRYTKDPIFTAFGKIFNKLNTMKDETGFLPVFFERYKNGISKLLSRDRFNLRLYCIEVSEEEVITGNGGKKPGGRGRPFQSSARLERNVNILASLRPKLFSRMKENNVDNLYDLINLNKENAKFRISYEEPIE